MRIALLSALISAVALAAEPAPAGKADSPDKAYLVTAAKEKGAEKLPSGVIVFTSKVGTGAAPTAASTVKVHYRGTLISGKEFDSSYKRNEPIEFALGDVVPCWTQGVQKMKVGGKAKLVCPAETAYGDKGAGDVVPPNATLVFEIELLAVK